MRWSGAAAGRCLRIRDFRVYYIGQLASLCGTWCQTVALAWLVLDRTGSGTSLGILTACQFLPVILLGAYSGVVADRFDNRRAVIAVQSLLGLQAAALTLVVVLDHDQLWVLCALAAVQGVGTAMDVPTRQSLVGQLVPRADLANALALNGGLVQLARIVGPVAAAALIATAGPEVCFAVNAASYTIVVTAVALIHTRVERSDRSTVVRVRDGLAHAWNSPGLRQLLGLSIAFSFAATTTTVALPVHVRQTFDGDATMYGLLAACHGVGALVGAAALASRVAATKRHLLGSYSLTAVALIGLAVAPGPAIATVPLLCAGFGMFTTGITLNSSLQLGARPDMRGRIIALYFLVLFGANAAFGPAIGVLTDAAGPRSTFAVVGALTGVIAFAVATEWRRDLDGPPVEPAHVETIAVGAT